MYRNLGGPDPKSGAFWKTDNFAQDIIENLSKMDLTADIHV